MSRVLDEQECGAFISEGTLPLAACIGGRYMGADRAEEFDRRNAVEGELLVRLRPEQVIAEADVAA